MEASKIEDGNIKSIKEALQLAIDAENYELAAKLRDQLKEIDQKKLTMGGDA